MIYPNIFHPTFHSSCYLLDMVRVATGGRKNARRGAPRAAEVDVVLDELLDLVFLRLPSYLDLVRAACVCRRWRRVIAGDGGGFLRRFGSLRGASSPHVVGRYRVDARHQQPRPPGRNPVFVPSSRQRGTVAQRNLALDFLPRGEYGGRRWELVDSRGGLLLLLADEGIYTVLLVCDPLARRYKEIPNLAWFRDCDFLGAFLLDGEDAGTRFSMSNFRVTCAVYRCGHRIVRACAFSSVRGGRWTSGAGRSSTADCGLGIIHFAGSDDGFAYWTAWDNIVLTLDKDAAEFTSSVLHDDGEYDALQNKHHATEYAYHQPWSPTIEACLS